MTEKEPIELTKEHEELLARRVSASPLKSIGSSLCSLCHHVKETAGYCNCSCHTLQHRIHMGYNN